MSKSKSRRSSALVASWLVLLLIFSLGLTVSGEKRETIQEPQKDISILIIDQTNSFATSIQTELLARNLTEQLSVKVQARQDIPREVGQREFYRVIFVTPKRASQVWVLTGVAPYKIPENKRKALEGIHKIAKKVYLQDDFPKREVVGIADDLAPAAYASYLVRYGWLEGRQSYNVDIDN